MLRIGMWASQLDKAKRMEELLMNIIIWGTGHMSRLIEDYIKQNIEIVAYIDNDKNTGGGMLKRLNVK